MPPTNGGAVLLKHSSRGSDVQLLGADAWSSGADTATQEVAPTEATSITGVVGELTRAARLPPNDRLAVGVTWVTAGSHAKEQLTV